MLKPSQNVLGQLQTMKGARTGVGDVLFAAPTVAYIGVSAIRGLGRIARDGTIITNPWFYRNAHSGYGKRGIDAEAQGAGGLVGGLHNRRRTAR